jgi:hypothetical protein
LVRVQVNESLLRLSVQRTAVRAILQQNLLHCLMELMPGERLDIQLIILQTCHNLIHHGASYMPEEALRCGALDSFLTLLKDSSMATDLKVAAAKGVMMLSYYLEAKALAAKPESLHVLYGLLSDRKSEVRAAALGALMSISVDVGAKQVMSREQMLPTLMMLLDDENELVVLNGIKTITNCAEDLRARPQLAACIHKVRVLDCVRAVFVC